MITLENYKSIEEVLNSELAKESGYESWMNFSIKIMEGAEDRFVVGYLLPTSHGIKSTKTLGDVMPVYHAVANRVLGTVM